MSKLPTVSELTELVQNKLITQEEAKDILFKSESDTDRDKESLEKEIEFLRRMVEKLSSRSQITEVIKEIKTPYYQYPWYQPYMSWCGGVTTNAVNAYGVTTTLGTSNNFTLTNTAAGTGGQLAQSDNFSSIKTF